MVLKQAVGILASAAGIAGVALLLGVLARLSWDSRDGFSVPSQDGNSAAPPNKVLHEA